MFTRPYLGIHGAAFHDGEQVALDAFAGNVGGTLLRAAGELVDFVDKHDAHLLHALTGEIGDLVLVHELGGLVLDEMTPRRADLIFLRCVFWGNSLLNAPFI